MGMPNATNFKTYKVVDTIECEIGTTDDGFVLDYTKEQLLDVVRSLNLNDGDTVVLNFKKKEN